MRVLLLFLLLGAASAVPCTTKARTTGATRSTVQDSTSVPVTVATGVPDSSGAPTETVFTTGPSFASTAGSITSGSSVPSIAGSTENAEVDLELVNAFSSTTTTVTPTPTTLPQVNVSYVQFTFADCVNGYCSYTYLAPKNDASLIAKDDSIVDTDECTYEDDVVLVNNYNSSLEAIVLNATVQVDNLQQQLNNASDLLNQIVADLQATIENINNATFYLNLPNTYVNNVAKGGSNDCFNRCTLPPTTPAPTTTPTPAPTTTQAFCDRPENQDFCTGDRTCDTDSGGNFCTGCEGNEDKYKQCLMSDCYPDGTNAIAGPFWSPGYNKTGDMSAMPSGKTCRWDYEMEPKTALLMNTVGGSYNLSSLGTYGNRTKPYAYLQPIDGDDVTICEISSSTNPKKINQCLYDKITNSHLTKFSIYVVTPTSAAPEQFFYWEFVKNLITTTQAPTTTTKART